MIIFKIEHLEDCEYRVGYWDQETGVTTCRGCGEVMHQIEAEGDDIPEEFRADAPKQIVREPDGHPT